MPQIPRLASLRLGAQGNHRSHYSADWRSRIAPNKPLLSGKPATLFPTTPTNPNKIKGHGNPVLGQGDFLSQRKKSVFTDTYVTF
ncbi:hypothetical protein [Aeromonas jandaei]|uniref:hypothetical protein n=1 Tax=Aeromonas jandaei TaxID=650 RepID=UPI003EC5BA6F